MANTRQNPYVGPRAFTLNDKEKLAGRDRDITALYRLLIAERIVLMFSPSGAGKTSLVQAGLIPRMAEKGFNVLPVIRVSREIPAGLGQKTGMNRYVLSVIESLDDDENLPGGEHTVDEKLINMRLKDYFSGRLPSQADSDDEDDYQGGGRKSFLILDQFEEILTIDPNDREGKWEFFTQLGEALERRDCWALFVAREDFVAALDPYLRLIPTRLASTYRLDLLDYESAQQAIRKPAQLMGVEYTDDAAEKLVNDLRSVRVQQPDGSWEPQAQLGRYVEPVQLQVVCFRLWSKIEDTTEITEKHIESLGNVDDALAGFYADQVDSVEKETGVPEKEIRAWFDNVLITPNGIRSQVMREKGQSGGLSNSAIEALEKTYLIRGDTRRGVRWYELAHDRLIEPVRKNNLEWFSKNLSTLQRQAMLWEAQERPDHLLLRDNALIQAEKWAEGKTLTGAEPEFLKACQDFRNGLQAEEAKKEAEAQKQKAEELGKLNNQLAKSNRGLRVRNFIALALLTISVIAVIVALTQWGIAKTNESLARANAATAVAASNEANAQKTIADQNAKIAIQQEATAVAAEAEARTAETNAKVQSQINLSSSLAAHASTLVDKNPPLAALLSLEALNFAKQTNTYQPAAEQNLRDLLGKNQGYALNGHAHPISHVAFSPDENLLITADNAGTSGTDTASQSVITLWNLNAKDLSKANIKLSQGQLRDKLLSGVAFSPDNRLLAVGSKTGTDSGEAGVVYLLEISKNGVSQNSPVEIIVEPGGGEVSALAFGKRGDVWWLAAGMSNGKVALVNVSTGVTDYKVLQLTHGITRMNVLTFSPDGRWLAGGSEEDQVRIWDVDNPIKGPASHSQSGAVRSLVYSPNGNYLVGAGGAENINGAPKEINGGAKEIYVYNGKIRENQPFTLAKDLSNVTTLVFDPADPRLVAVGYANGAIKIWNIASTANRPFAEFSGHGEILYLAYSPDGQWLVSAGQDMAVRLWDVSNLETQSDQRSKLLKIFTSEISAMAFSPGGRWLVVGTTDNEVQLWDFRLGFESLDPINLGKSYDSYRSALFSPNGQWMAARKEEGDNLPLFLWKVDDFANGNREPAVKVKNTDQKGFSSNAFSPDGKLFALGSKTGNTSTIDIFDLAKPEAAPRTLEKVTGGLVYVGISPKDGRWLVSCDGAGNIHIWDTRNLEAEPNKKKIDVKPFNASQISLAFSPQGRWLAAVAVFTPDTNAVFLWDLNNPQAEPLVYPGTEGGPYTFSFSADERWFGVGTAPVFDTKTNTARDGQVYLWDLSIAQPVPSLFSGHSGYVNTLEFSPDSTLMASGDDAGYLRVWDLAKPTSPLAVIHNTNNWITRVEFSPNGRWLAASNTDGVVELWETKSLGADPGAGHYSLSGHQGPIWNLGFSPDNRWIATGSSDRTIRLWSLGFPRSEPIVLSGFNGVNSYLNFDPQMRFLASYTNLKESQLWHLNPADLRSLACQVANRNLTEDEWRQYMPEGLQRTATCSGLPLP